MRLHRQVDEYRHSSKHGLLSLSLVDDGRGFSLPPRGTAPTYWKIIVVIDREASQVSTDRNHLKSRPVIINNHVHSTLHERRAQYACVYR